MAKPLALKEKYEHPLGEEHKPGKKKEQRTNNKTKTQAKKRQKRKEQRKKGTRMASLPPAR